jgi:hypothetical protein
VVASDRLGAFHPEVSVIVAENINIFTVERILIELWFLIYFVSRLFIYFDECLFV